MYIAEDAFEKSIHATVAGGSYAYEWCIENNIDFAVISIETPAECFAHTPIDAAHTRITGFSGEADAISIPSELDGYIVTELADNLFSGCESLTYVQLPDSLTSIGAYAFNGCTNLKTPVFPKGLETIGYCAFYNCEEISIVVLPSSVTVIDSYAFASCERLHTIDLSPNWSMVNGGTSPFTDNPLLTSVVIPEGMEVIPSKAFDTCESLTNVIFPDSVKHISSYAFYNCESLQDVSFPDSLTTIEYAAFSGCSSFTTVTLPASVTTLGSYAFSSCGQLNAVILSPNWSMVEGSTSPFTDNPLLTSIVIPEGMEVIPAKAFDTCVSLTNVTFPDSVQGIDSYAFYRCASLTNVIFPDSVKNIGSYAFCSCESLQDVSFPDALTTIEYAAFSGCSSFTTVTLPASVTTLGSYAFSSCGQLNTVILSPNWSMVEGSTSPFTDNPLFTSVVIPEGMEVIPSKAFDTCVSITNVTFSDSVKNIGSYAFYNCESLQDVSFPDSLTTIEYAAFSGCSNFATVTLPVSVTTLGSHAFSSCGQLNAVTLSPNWSMVEGSQSPFTDNPQLTSIVIPEGMEAIPAKAFDTCVSLTNVTFPDSVKNIDAYAFYNCSSLPYVYISPDVTVIGSSAFGGCDALTIESEYGAKAISYAKENGISYYYLSLTAASKPTGRLYCGDIFTVKGYVRSNYLLTRVVSTIYNADKTEILYQVDLEPENETDFNLNSYLNSEMHFSALALGSYCFELKASTERSEEMFLDTTFTIVPPPLRVTLSNENSPSGLQSIGSAVSIGGIVRSNYLITSVTIEIRKDSDNTLVTGKTVSPNTYTYNVSSLAASMDTASLKTGDYVYILRIVSNNQTRRMAYSEFSMRAYDAEVPEDTYNAVYNFVTTNDSQTFWKFIGTHMMKKYCEVDSASNYLLLSWSKYHEAVNSYFKNYFAADQGAEFRKNLYKEQLLKIIQSSADTASPSGSIIKNMELIRSSLLKYGKIEATYILENGGQLSEAMKEYIKTYNKCLDHMGKTIDAFKFADDVIGIITEQAGNYETEMDFLDGLADSFANSSSDEKKLYLIALEEIEAEYQSRTYKVLSKIYDKMTSEMVKKGTSVVTSFIFKAVGGTGIAYSVTTLAVDLLAELTGANEAADELVEFITLCECAMAANNTYSDAHTAVVAAIANETAPTPEQINKLLTSFDVAKKCTLRLINHMIKNADSSAESNVYLQEMSRINKVTILGD